jgi:hypothetical protein
MAEIAVGEAVGEGFGLIRRKPLAVLTWGLLQTSLIVLAFMAVAPMYAALIAAAVRQAQTGAAAAPPDLQGMMQAQSLVYLVDMASFVASAVTSCAVFRAVLRPEQGAFAYLRLGAAELYLAVLIFAGAMVVGVGMFVAMIPILLVVFVLVGLHAGAAAAIFGVVVAIAAVVAAFYLGLRVSLVGPMMVDDGQFRLTEAWALTKGKVVGLLAIGLLLMLILIAGEIILGLIMVVAGAGVLGVLAGGLQNIPVLLQQQPQALVGRLTPFLAIAALVWIPLSGCAAAVVSAPWARAYRDLRPKRDIAETFA